VDRISEPVLLGKCGSAGNRTRDLWICSQELGPLASSPIIIILNTYMTVNITKTLGLVQGIVIKSLSLHLTSIPFYIV
jgi:hypothetical protein